MGDGFSVDLGALENAASGVNSTLYELQKKKVKDIDADEGDYGEGDLGGTVSDFCERWELGVENLAKDGQEIAGRLSKSVQQYLLVDKNLKGYMDGILQRSSGEDPGVH
ncbi:hypothetical protein [Labedaea rhizosphaerae]|uniref:Excreted virulence factor EspC (Type VII ESX diderm) n=1 Tax=Labedaea rhizosphaerae TaxID=598644 RepID=A0A4R6SED9_LABRH|nr:hypothetical protein [Labedaea rhizosphaerae]TDP98087.1 hypothetical protein EV186_1031067 [Labedaea rhizosphaerae]